MHLSKFLIAAVLSISLLGCTGAFSVHEVPTQAELKVSPNKVILNQVDEYNAKIAAAAKALKASKLSFTTEEYSKYSKALKDSAKYTDQAEAYAKMFDLTSAAGKLELADILLTLVESELIKQKEKETK